MVEQAAEEAGLKSTENGSSENGDSNTVNGTTEGEEASSVLFCSSMYVDYTEKL